MSLDQVLWECFRHFVHLDHSNAAIHCSSVRYSPITFRIAEALDDVVPDVGGYLTDESAALLKGVLGHKGAYAEDEGR